MGFHNSPDGARESNALLLRMRLTGIQDVCTFAKGTVCDPRIQYAARNTN